MSLKVIELNDSAIKVGNESGIVHVSRGFACATGDTILFGEEAEQQARLQPTNAFNKYWQELNLEPLSHSPKIRHFADLAYLQLQHLAELGEIDKEVIFAVPANFNRQQLAILLGLAQQTPFTPVGVVDSALAAALAIANADNIVYVDMQLHQVVLTWLKTQGELLVRDSVVQIPGVGRENFMDQMMQLATGLFIQQCRFNPQHNAESEQQLYNMLPLWLQQETSADDTLLLELKTSTAVHNAKMPRESLISQLSDQYRSIEQQIAAVAGSGEQLLLSANFAALPGLRDSLSHYPDVVVVEPEGISETVLQYRELITQGNDAGITLTDTLPAKGGTMPGPAAQQLERDSAAEPTHALYGHEAVAIDRLELKSAAAINGRGRHGSALFLGVQNQPEQLGRIVRRDGGIFLNAGELQVMLNDTKVRGEQRLRLGDRIRYATDKQDIALIRVNDGR